MRVDVTPTHDVHNLYLRWIVGYDGPEKARLERLGGPVALEIETSCYIDLAGARHETARVKIPIWPYAGPQNHGQARFWDVDSRRRFWVNLLDAVTKRVADFLWEAKPGSVGKDGVTISVPEGAARPTAPASSGS